MRQKMKYKSKLILLVFTLIVFKSYAENKVSVSVKPKQFDGITRIVDDKVVNEFLGIPYAKPPIGGLRFKKPVPYEYDEPIDATKWGNPCVQPNNSIEDDVIGNNNYSEDCLYLNLWSPNDSQIPLPVLFWIHSGAFVSGASNIESYQGDILSVKANIIVVTINYRLGVLGGSTSSESSDVNIGLWDQAMALKWVNDNIRYFGGDPSKITIGGHGAGGWAVSIHILSPITRNLFKYAVMMSGSALVHFCTDINSVNTRWIQFAEDLGCKQRKDNEIMECLRNISSDVLVNTRTRSTPYLVYGDEFLPRKPIEMLKSGDFKKNLKLLMSTTDDDGSHILTLMVDPEVFNDKNPKNITKPEAKIVIKKMLSEINTDVHYEDVYRLYTSQLAPEDYQSIRRSIGIAFGDYLFTCPTIGFGKLLYSNDKNKSKVYQYLWTLKNTDTWHGNDNKLHVQYIFGSPFRKSDSNSSQKEMSEKIVETLSNFVKNGYPSPQEGIDWNSYYMIADELISPYYEFGSNIPYGNTGGRFRIGFKYECTKLWKRAFLNK